MVDFASLLDGPIYKTIGKSATITPASSPGAVTVTAIDLTRGVSVQHGAGAFNSSRHTASVQTVVAAAKVRLSELSAKGLTLDDIRGARLDLNGRSWRIHSTEARPAPEGEDDGEAFLILQKWT